MLSAALKTVKQPSALVNVFEHRLSSETSPMVSFAMTIPAGNKFSIGEEDCGQIAAAYKHVLLQGTSDESKISFARKADLRPSPISSTLTFDLLTIHSSFHINYLPEMISTFKNLFSSRKELEIENFDLENWIKPSIVLDGQLAHEDSKILLLEAARRTVFQSNNSYFSSSSDLKNILNTENLKKFHKETLERATGKDSTFSFLLSVNDSKLINQSELSDLVSSDHTCTVNNNVDSNPVCDLTYTGSNSNRCVKLEINDPDYNEFMIAFNIPFGGFNQKNYFYSLIIESLLKKFIPSVQSSITCDTSLVTIYFKFDRNELKENIKNNLKSVIDQIKLSPEMLKDEDLIKCQDRVKFNRALAIESRDNRLLTFAHHYSHSGILYPKYEPSSNSNIRDIIKKVLQGDKPILIERGNYKKMFEYNELF